MLSENIRARRAGLRSRTDLQPARSKLISTSRVERQNLTLRMSQRRFTRRTNCFFKKLINHAYSVALHYTYYNFCRVHQSIGTTPAAAAGVADGPAT